MKRMIRQPVSNILPREGNSEGVYWSEGADGRLYVTALGTLDHAFELGFDTTDPVTGKHIDVDPSDLYELWADGEVELTR